MPGTAIWTVQYPGILDIPGYVEGVDTRHTRVFPAGIPRILRRHQTYPDHGQVPYPDDLSKLVNFVLSAPIPSTCPLSLRLQWGLRSKHGGSV